MKKLLCLSLAIIALGSVFSRAATPEQEKAFVENYRKALEAKDEKALFGFLSTEGADAETLSFYKMMQPMQFGGKIVSIELTTPTAAEVAEFNTVQEGPNGKKYKMPLKLTKYLVIKTESTDVNRSTSASSKTPVAEKAGKLVIPLPVPAKK